MSKFQLQMSGQWNQQVMGKEVDLAAAAGVSGISLDNQATASIPSAASNYEGFNSLARLMSLPYLSLLLSLSVSCATESLICNH